MLWTSWASIAILSKQILFTYVKRNINCQVTADVNCDVVFVKDLASNVFLIHWWEMCLILTGGAFSSKCVNMHVLPNAQIEWTLKVSSWRKGQEEDGEDNGKNLVTTIQIKWRNESIFT